MWELTVDDKGRICLPKPLRKEFALEGKKVVLLKMGGNLVLQFPPMKEIGTVPFAGMTTDAAEELQRQGVSVVGDGDKKVVVLKSE